MVPISLCEPKSQPKDKTEVFTFSKEGKEKGGPKPLGLTHHISQEWGELHVPTPFFSARLDFVGGGLVSWLQSTPYLGGAVHPLSDSLP